MTDATWAPPNTEPDDSLTGLFAAHHGRLVEHLDLMGAGPEQAEDWAMETWERVTACLEECPAGGAAVWGWLTGVAARVAAAHDRRPNRELPAAFAGEVEQQLLPHTASAEDMALTFLTVRELAADEPAPWGVAA